MKKIVLSLLASLTFITPQVLQAAPTSTKLTLFNFRDYMPGEGNCEGVAYQVGKRFKDGVYASWDAQKEMIWISLDGKVYKSKFTSTELTRMDILETTISNLDVVIMIRQSMGPQESDPNGVIEIFSRTSDASLGRFDVKIAEAC